jgi:nitrite reductase/ring-hydroxylating ferredoxin subunit
MATRNLNLDSKSRSAINRRELLTGSLAFFGSFPQCCRTPALGPEAFRFEARSLSVDLEKAGELRQVGSAAAVVDGERNLDIIIIRLRRHQFAVLDRSCTHNGAQCTYDQKRHTLRCTSLNHAEYDLKGTLLHGRTHGNLRTYEARLAGSILQIRL